MTSAGWSEALASRTLVDLRAGDGLRSGSTLQAARRESLLSSFVFEGSADRKVSQTGTQPREHEAAKRSVVTSLLHS